MIFIAQGFDTSAPQSQTLVTVHGLVDGLYLEDLRQRTFRGVEQRALEGLHTGGRVFGYRRVPIESQSERDSHGRPIIEGVKLEVDREQAATVRRIFERYAAGHSLKRIAMDLNNEGVASPQPQKGRVSQSWCPSSVRHILHNERYRGVVLWGRHRKIRSPKTGKRIYERRPENEWRRTEVPEQRIVSDELWNAVQQRMKTIHRLYGAEGSIRMRGGRAAASPYLFAGLLECALCHGSITIVSGTWKRREDSRYGCSMHAYRGDRVCTNSLLIERRALEEQLLAGLQTKVLHPDVVSYTLRRFEEELLRATRRPRHEVAELRRKEAELEQRATNLTRALADGYSPSIRAELAEVEKQVVQIREKVALAQGSAGAVQARDTRRFVEERLVDLRTLLNAEPIMVRTEIAQHMQKITLRPEGRTYVALGTCGTC